MQSLPPERLVTALLLAAIAGMVDSVGFMELGGYFVSFMTGNSTRLGLNVAAHQWSSALSAAGLVALFVGGVTTGVLIRDHAGRRAPMAILLLEAALLSGAAILLDGSRPMWGTVLLPVAMGLANVFLMSDSAVSIGVTYMTGTLVRVGVGLASLGEPGRARAITLDLMLWVSLVSGAVIGGLGRTRLGGDVLFLAVGTLLATALMEWRRPRRVLA
jgi:uncharacterized membrane protein YoaK (UPF0700 family)